MPTGAKPAALPTTLPEIPFPIHKLGDRELLDLSYRLAQCKKIAGRRFLALLPEINRRKLHKAPPPAWVADFDWED